MKREKILRQHKLDQAMCDAIFFLREALDGTRWPVGHPKSKFTNSVCKKSINWMRSAAKQCAEVVELYNQFCEEEGYEKINMIKLEDQ